MAESTMPSNEKKGLNLGTAILLILPVILLGVVIVLFLTTGGGLQLQSPVPIEDLVLERVTLSENHIDITMRNAGPEDVTIAQVAVNEAFRGFDVTPDATIERLSEATIHMEYGWVEGEAYGVSIFTTNAIVFDVEIPVAHITPQPTGRTFLGFTLIGLYVGVIPVYLGLFWFPALRQLGRRSMTFLLALTAGLLIFLGIDTLAEALEQVARVPGPFQGVGLIAIGVVVTFMVLDAISQRQQATGRSDAERRLTLAYMIAIGIGLHNLGEGLAIGSAFAIGEIALGAFLVVGFIIQNITEGLGIIAPVLRDRPGWKHLAIMGLIGGAPAILGTWIGGYISSPTFAVLFLALGTGAVFEVVYEIAKMIQADMKKDPRPVMVMGGVLAGMMLLWVTGLLIK